MSQEKAFAPATPDESLGSPNLHCRGAQKGGKHAPAQTHKCDSRLCYYLVLGILRGRPATAGSQRCSSTASRGCGGAHRGRRQHFQRGPVWAPGRAGVLSSRPGGPAAPPGGRRRFLQPAPPRPGAAPGAAGPAVPLPGGSDPGAGTASRSVSAEGRSVPWRTDGRRGARRWREEGGSVTSTGTSVHCTTPLLLPSC